MIVLTLIRKRYRDYNCSKSETTTNDSDDKEIKNNALLRQDRFLMVLPLELKFNRL